MGQKLAILAAAAAMLAGACTQTPSADAGRSAGPAGIGFPTPAAAFKALKGRKDIPVSVVDGWTIFNERAAKTVWTFTPPDHPAHPAVVKRELVVNPETIDIVMNVLCGATKAACDRLVADFQRSNEELGRRMRRQAPLEEIEL